ncbi:hypothetical protein IFM89_007511 [Coptis chinensis]|uniref:Uncharacterized protein n=1 Tax=Coptis chinensis TaxID=261450 RepID=A0A835HRL1_9MAGN|nr:hypothetical protein IFM89_007511 [Coptis chinensis]
MKYESASSKAPIVSGREHTTSADERKLGVERSGELSGKVNQFILRRTNALLSNHLPPKFPKCFYSVLVRYGSWTGGDGFWVELSGKMHVFSAVVGPLAS